MAADKHQSSRSSKRVRSVQTAATGLRAKPRAARAKTTLKATSAKATPGKAPPRGTSTARKATQLTAPAKLLSDVAAATVAAPSAVTTPAKAKAKPRKPTKTAGAATLPARLMFDAATVIMALEYENPARRRDQRVRDARELWERALRECTVLVPPFVVLALQSHGAGAPLPPIRNLMHVAFTYEVAESMIEWAHRLTAAPLLAPRKRSSKARAVKQPPPSVEAQASVSVLGPDATKAANFDVALVGCAKFYAADVLISFDAALRAIGHAAGVESVEPSALLRWTQRALPGIGQ
jgi:hypothetical protein